MKAKNVQSLDDIEELSDTDYLLVGQDGSVKKVLFSNAKTTLTKVLGEASSTSDGLMSTTDKDALDAITAAGGVETSNLADGAVTNPKIADGVVNTAKLTDDAVTTAKILDANVTDAKLATDSVTTDKIKDSNVTEGKIAGSAVTSAKIADDAVTSAKLDDSVVSAGNGLAISEGVISMSQASDSAFGAAEVLDNLTASAHSDGVALSAHQGYTLAANCFGNGTATIDNDTGVISVTLTNYAGVTALEEGARFRVVFTNDATFESSETSKYTMIINSGDNSQDVTIGNVAAGVGAFQADKSYEFIYTGSSYDCLSMAYYERIRFPDYGNIITLSSSTWTATTDCYINYSVRNSGTFSINGTVVSTYDSESAVTVFNGFAKKGDYLSCYYLAQKSYVKIFPLSYN